MRKTLFALALLIAMPASAVAECEMTFDQAVETARDGIAKNPQTFRMSVIDGDNVQRLRAVWAAEMNSEVIEMDKVLFVENSAVGLVVVDAIKDGCVVASVIAPVGEFHHDLDKALGPES